MNAPALRPRSVGEILDTAFQLYRARFSEMAAATAVLVSPLLLLEIIAPLNVLPLLEFVKNIFFMAASAAVVVIASGAYEGRVVPPGEAIRAVRARFLSVWGSAIFQSILVSLGLLLLVVPGLFALAYTFAMQQAVMIEDRRTDDAFQRSKALAEDNVKRILATVVLAFLIVIVATIGGEALFTFFSMSLRMQVVLTNVVLIGLNPLAAVAGTVMYYDLRIRKEAYDVEVATERLGSAVPVPAF